MSAPIYPVAEHILQLGGEAIAYALEDETIKKGLEKHIIEEHLLVPVLDSKNIYDLRVRPKARLLEQYRQEVEKVTRELIRICDREDVNPWFLLAVSRSTIDHLRERRRRKGDLPGSWDNPKDIPPGDN